MAQARIDESLLVDPRFREAVQILRDKPDFDEMTTAELEEMTLGKFFRAVILAQKYWRDDRKLIPKDIWSMRSCASFASLFIQVGLAEDRDDGIYLCGSSLFFDWYHAKSEAGKLGGKKSAEKRKAKSEQKKLKQAKQRYEAAEALLPKHEPVMFCSSSVSVSDSKKNTESDKPDSAPTGAPPSALVDLWNQHRGKLPAARLTTKRRAKVTARLKEQPELAYWERVIKRLAASSFATGTNDRGWTADLGWLMANDENHVKVDEGKYDDRKPAARDSVPLIRSEAELNAFLEEDER